MEAAADQIRVTHFLPARLDALGVPFAAICQRARVPQALFAQDRVVVSTAQWFALWRAVGELNTDPALGLRLPGAVLGRPYDPIAITAFSARSFYEGLLKIARYKRLFCSEQIAVAQDGDLWRLTVAWSATREPPPTLLIDSMFASFVELGRHGAGEPLYPARVALRRPPRDRAMYESFFRCPVDFEADRDAMAYAGAVMHAPFAMFNPELLALIEPQLEAELRASQPLQPLGERVRALLRSRLAGQQPTLQSLADELGVSVRTLQRWLASEGLGFQQVLEQARRDMARHYLRGSALELSEIAFLLGYEEASSFHRAFHQWEGTTPGQWRAANRARP